MGEISEMMLDGTLCQFCGAVFDDLTAPGFPRTCKSCSKEHKTVKKVQLTDSQRIDLLEKEMKKMRKLISGILTILE